VGIAVLEMDFEKPGVDERAIEMGAFRDLKANLALATNDILEYVGENGSQ
jgi:hypothetical protein